uniref:C-type lectin domain-containing protein n=1 Tax=Anopheles minimus TaxID=112268 RepID=A0A182W816_9DIPT
MEQPLCAVVDPVRDFRWHAFRCGGPETAAFLCELPVPTWAVDCTITSIPSLTVQYMSDSGTVQLSRDCGESGTKHITCQGKQDRDSIIDQLQCSDEEDLASVLAVDNNNQLLQMLGANSVTTSSSTRQPQPQPILEHDILTVVSSNDEESNNKIEVNPNQIEDTVKNVINKFNLQDLMRSELVALHSDELDSAVHNAGSLRKPSYIKKYSPLYEKKNHSTKKNSRSERNDSGDEEDEDDEPMLGDQPMQDETEPQPIDIIQQAVKPTADVDYADPVVVVSGVKKVNGKCSKDGLCANSAISATTTEIITTPDSRLRRGTDSDGDEETTANTTDQVTITVTSDITETTTTTTTISVPTVSVSPTTIATGAPPTLLTTRTTVSSHILPTTPKKEVITGDHFIPPMLLVKARFISARPQTESPPTTLLPTVASTIIPVETGITISTSAAPATSDANISEHHEKSDRFTIVETTSSESAIDILHDEVSSASSIVLSTTDVHQASRIVFEKNQSQQSEQPNTLSIITNPLQAKVTTPAHLSMNHKNNPNQAAALVSSIHLTQFSDSISITTAPEQDSNMRSSEPSKISTSVPIITVKEEVTTNKSETEVYGSSKTSTCLPPLTTEQDALYEKQTTMPFINEKIEIPEETGLIAKTPASNQKTSIADEHTIFQENKDNHTHEEHEDYDEQKHSELHNSFSNVENYQPYKPNRHRTLTKPEVHNNHGAYIKKILG